VIVDFPLRLVGPGFLESVCEPSPLQQVLAQRLDERLELVERDGAERHRHAAVPGAAHAHAASGRKTLGRGRQRGRQAVGATIELGRDAPAGGAAVVLQADGRADLRDVGLVERDRLPATALVAEADVGGEQIARTLIGGRLVSVRRSRR
jgi:hypothetical protein